MKSTVEQINPVQYRVQVEVTSDEVNQAFETVFRRIQKKASIQGFRPGKAPFGMIRKLYTEQATQEVHESLVNKHLSSALSEQTIRPIASPVLESSEIPTFDKPFVFKAVVDILPQLEFDDYKGLSVATESYKVTDATLENELNKLRRQHGRMRPVDDTAAAALGMVATLSHTATLDGNAVPGMDVKGMNVALGQKELFEGLEAHVLGMTVGQSKTATVTLPSDYPASDLAAKSLEFNLTLDALQHLDLPALDDEFAKDLDIESAEALRERVKENLEARAKDMSRQKLETAILDKVLEKHSFEVPPALVDQVIDSMIGEFQFKSEADRQAAVRNAELRDRCLPGARRRTQNTLVLWHVTQKEQVKVTDEEVQAQVAESLGAYGQLDAKSLAYLKSNYEMRVRENLLFEKAMNILVENAKVDETVKEL